MGSNGRLVSKFHFIQLVSALGLVSAMLPNIGTASDLTSRHPEAVVATPYFLKDVLQDGVSSLIGLNLKINGSHGMTHYQYKLGTIDSIDCSDSVGYSSLIEKQQSIIKDISGYADNTEMVLCLLGQKVKKGRLLISSHYQIQRDMFG